MNTLVTPTLRFRFKEKEGRRVMQQMHAVAVFDLAGQPFKQYGEWQDVPFVGPDASDVEQL